MRRLGVRVPLLAWAAFLATFVVACSLEDASSIGPGDSSRSSAEASGDSLDSGAVKKDTVYHHREVTVCRDTVERVNEIQGTSFLSFVYRKDSGVLDTVTRDSNALKCDMGEESFSCEYFAQYIIDEPFIGPVVYVRDSISLTLLDTTKVHIYVVDTVYKDTFYRNTYKRINDTTFINYGESRITDYIPPETTYDLGEHPFDSAAIRDFFDTLDVSDSLLGGKNHLEVNSELRFIGFPLSSPLIEAQFPIVEVNVARLGYKAWPTTEKAPKRSYNFSNKFVEFESDTTVTWTLEYTHYERGQEEKDSIQVTTFFKTARSTSEE